MTPEKTNATSVSEYRNKIGEAREITMPSGAVFVLRRLTPIDYIKEGLADIPNEFVQFISEVTAGKPTNQSSEELKKNYELFASFLKVTVEKGVVSPPVLMQYDAEKVDTHLVFGELSPEDQAKMINVILGKE